MKINNTSMKSEGFNTDLFTPANYSREEYFIEKEVVELEFDRAERLTTRTRPKIHITSFEISLLAFLQNQGLLSSKQLFNLWNAYYPTKYWTFIAKLKRWADKGVVTIRNDTKRDLWGRDINYYGIDKKGLGILRKKGYLREAINANSIEMDSKKKNLDHLHGIQEVVINLIIELLSHGLSITSLRPSSVFDEDSTLVPDWVLRLYCKNSEKDTFIYIDFDTGTGPLKTIHSKLDEYSALARANDKYNHIALVALEDSSLYTTNHRKVYKGAERIKNIKQLTINQDDKHPDNLDTFVGHMSDVYGMMIYHLTGGLSNDIENMEQSLIKHLNGYGYTIGSLDDYEVYQSKVPKQYYADNVFEVRNNAGNIVERIGVLYCAQGLIKNAYRIREFSDLVESRSFLRNVKHRLIVIYPSTHQRMYDYYRLQYNRNVLFTDLDSLRSGKERVFKQTTSANSKKMTFFED